MANWGPKDVITLVLVVTVAIVLIASTVATVLLGFDDGGRTGEIIAFLLGSIVTIIGEYVLLQIKSNYHKDDDSDDK